MSVHRKLRRCHLLIRHRARRFNVLPNTSRMGLQYFATYKWRFRVMNGRHLSVKLGWQHVRRLM